MCDMELTPENIGDILKNLGHEKQPHTINGKRGDFIVSDITVRQLAECFIRGMLDGATNYRRIDPINLDYDHLIDLIYEVEWMDDFDPIAIVQCASCHIEKVLGIYPNVDKLSYTEEKPTDA